MDDLIQYAIWRDRRGVGLTRVLLKAEPSGERSRGAAKRNHISFASRRRHDILIPPVRGTLRESWVGE